MKTVSNVAQELLEKVRFKYIDFESWCDRDEDIRVARDVIVSCESSNSVDMLYKMFSGGAHDLDKNILNLSKDSAKFYSNSDYDNWTRSLIYQDLLRILGALIIQQDICKLGSDVFSFEDHGCYGMYIYISLKNYKSLSDYVKDHVVKVDSYVYATYILRSIYVDLKYSKYSKEVLK